ncbi:MAG: TRAP transporter large permease [Moorellales bacterium]
MTHIAAAVIGLVVLFALLFAGLPVSVAMLLVGLAGLWALITPSAAIAKLAIAPFQTACSYDLATLPLFLLMANVLNYTGLGRDLFNLAYKWVGRLPGGVAITSLVSCGMFGAVSASSIATAATIGAVALPEMKRLGYRKSLAAGAVAAGGTLGSLIPPSGLLIIYGVLTETSIGKLFLAAWMPGIIAVALYSAATYIVCRADPSAGPPGEGSTFREKIAALKNAIEVISMMLVLIVGLLVGWFTPTEAGAIGAFMAILSAAIRKRLTWAGLKGAIDSTLRNAGMVYGILIGAKLFNYFLGSTGFPGWLSKQVAGLPLSPVGVVWIITAILLLLGIVMDEGAMQVLTIPILFPVIVHLGLDPLWFGILTTRLIQIGMISPPLGITMFVVGGLDRELSMTEVYRGVIPFLIADAVFLLLLVYVPEIALLLPSLGA